MNVERGVTELKEKNLKLIENNMKLEDDIAQSNSRYDMTLVFE